MAKKADQPNEGSKGRKGGPRRGRSPGHIRKRVSPSGTVRWQVIVSYRVGGRRKVLSSTCATFEAAQDRLGELIKESKRLSKPASSRIETVGDLLTKVEERRGQKWSPSTLRQWMSACQRHYVPKWGSRRLADITIEEVEEWLEDLASGDGTATRPLSGATLKRLLNPLSRAFDYAVAHKHTTDNPFKTPEMPAEEDSGEVDDYPDPVAAVRALAEVHRDPVTFAACQLAIDLGVRRGELVSIRWADLDLDLGICHIRRRAVLGPKDKTVIRPGTKTSKGRQIVLAQSTTDMLLRHREYCRELADRAGLLWDEGFYLFFQAVEMRLPLRPDTLSARWAAACLRAGVSMRFHDLRHLHASMLFAYGVDIVTVAKRLGHSPSGRVTMEHYAHRLREVEKAAAELAADAFRAVVDDAAAAGRSLRDDVVKEENS